MSVVKTYVAIGIRTIANTDTYSYECHEDVHEMEDALFGIEAFFVIWGVRLTNATKVGGGKYREWCLYLPPLCSRPFVLLSFVFLPVTLSPCHPVSLSPCHPVTLSPCHPVSLSPCLPVTLSPCHPVSLSPCHPVTLSPCLPVSLSI